SAPRSSARSSTSRAPPTASEEADQRPRGALASAAKRSTSSCFWVPRRSRIGWAAWRGRRKPWQCSRGCGRSPSSTLSASRSPVPQAEAMCRSCSLRRQNLVHLGGGEGPRGGRLNVPLRADIQQPCGDGLVVRGLEDEQPVKGSQSPVDLRDLDAQLLGGCL